jgi:hypothetical protein
LFPNDGLSIDEGITAATLTATLASSIVEAKRTSQRTTSYTRQEDKIICLAWLEISTDPICGVEMKGFFLLEKGGEVLS